MTRIVPRTSRVLAAPCGSLVVLFAALLWFYWPTLLLLISRWSADPQYTHAYVVPLFAVIVLVIRRDGFPRDDLEPSWFGLALLLIAVVMRLCGCLFAFEWLEAGSLLPALAGIMLLTLGSPVTRWAWPVFAFLAVILPWPWQLDQALTHPLRRVATVCSTYLLQTFGVPALSRGNIIVINDLEVGVVEACSGLGMLMTFFALSLAVALILRRPWFDRWTIFLSAVPIGILMNVLRISVTVLLYQFADAETARIVFHDVAGWVMMPLALVVMWLEILYLNWLWLSDVDDRPVPVPMSSPKPAPTEPPRWAQKTYTQTLSDPRPLVGSRQ